MATLSHLLICLYLLLSCTIEPMRSHLCALSIAMNERRREPRNILIATQAQESHAAHQAALSVQCTDCVRIDHSSTALHWACKGPPPLSHFHTYACILVVVLDNWIDAQPSLRALSRNASSRESCKLLSSLPTALPALERASRPVDTESMHTESALARQDLQLQL